MNTTDINFDNIIKDSNDNKHSANSSNKHNVGSDYTPHMTDEERIRLETYTDEELRDVNNIIVNIPDTSTPITIFFGAQSSGKTMVLLRMLRYLKEKRNFQFEPERVFRPASDKHYKRMCDNLISSVYNQYAPGGNDIISFMLSRVLSPEGHPVCQFLEAPGEHYFDMEKTVGSSFPTYINRVIATPNRKIWIILVQQNWGRDQTERNMYAQRICDLQDCISPKDRVVFLFNKCDMFSSQRLPNGRPNMAAFRKAIEGQYPGIFNRYQNQGWFSKILFGRDNFRTVCFSAGKFNFTNDGREVWSPSATEDMLCTELWNAINS